MDLWELHDKLNDIENAVDALHIKLANKETTLEDIGKALSDISMKIFHVRQDILDEEEKKPLTKEF